MKTLAFIFTISGLMLVSSLLKSSVSVNATAQNAVSLTEIIQNPLNAADFSGKLDELLTLEMVVKVSGFDAAKVIKEHGTNLHIAFGGEKGHRASAIIYGKTVAKKRLLPEEIQSKPITKILWELNRFQTRLWKGSGGIMAY